jgi:hypothetical protein
MLQGHKKLPQVCLYIWGLITKRHRTGVRRKQEFYLTIAIKCASINKATAILFTGILLLRTVFINFEL